MNGIADTSAVRREIAFRSVLTAKNPVALMARYLMFEGRYCRHQSERAVIRNWFRSRLRPRKYDLLRNLKAV